MLSVLDGSEYKKIAKVANSLGMGILTEISNEEKLERSYKI